MIRSSGMPASINAWKTTLWVRSGSRPILASKPQSKICLHSAASSSKSWPGRSTITKSPSFAKSRYFASSDLRRSMAMGCTHALFHRAQFCESRKRPSRAKPNRSSSPPPSMPTVTTSHSARMKSRLMRLSPRFSQKSAPVQRLARRFRPI
ncbi:hypothetical protein SDC9_202494 [bioreactor metagenome]|uniref:Uncharacterized protein n=1 Tax=bioreactor metagenome TaxID=1076179 RepID=A0A645IUJ4_9ZZZZ